MKRVIFDNDIGIDDAMALLFLHCSPEVSLEAITTGFGNASLETTTRNALFIKEKFGIKAPVYAGASAALGPTRMESVADFVHGQNGLGDIPLSPPSISAESVPAAQAIVDLVRQYPAEISLVAVGRLTNLADAFALAPELPGLVKEIVVMGGVFGVKGQQGNVSPVAEANIFGDPTAADRVFTSGAPITIVGLDVTEQTIIDDAFIEQLRHTSGAAGEFIYEISRFYFDFYEGLSGVRECPMHDSSAVAFLLRPEFYHTRSAAVRVVKEGIALGQTIYGDTAADYLIDAWRGTKACRFCVDVDAQAVLDLYQQTLKLSA